VNITTSQCTCRVTMWRDHVTILAMDTAKILFAGIVVLYVAVNSMKLSNNAHKYLCCEFVSPAAINLLR